MREVKNNRFHTGIDEYIKKGNILFMCGYIAIYSFYNGVSDLHMIKMHHPSDMHILYTDLDNPSLFLNFVMFTFRSFHFESTHAKLSRIPASCSEISAPFKEHPRYGHEQDGEEGEDRPSPMNAQAALVHLNCKEGKCGAE
jgi:hypothetical protein